jgi:hypothetical protein
MTGFRKTGLLAANAFFATAWGATKYFCKFFARRQNAASSRQHRETLPAAGPNEIRPDAGFYRLEAGSRRLHVPQVSSISWSTSVFAGLF